MCYRGSVGPQTSRFTTDPALIYLNAAPVSTAPVLGFNEELDGPLSEHPQAIQYHRYERWRYGTS